MQFLYLAYAASQHPPSDWRLWALGSASAAAAILSCLAARHIVYTAVTHLTTMVQRPFTAQDADGRPVLPPFTPLARRRISVMRAHLTNQLGNHVFQYIYARSLAATMGVRFSSPALGGPFKHLPTEVPPLSPAAAGKPPGSDAASLAASHLLNRAGNVWMQDTGLYSAEQWRDIKAWLNASVDRCGADLAEAIAAGKGGGALPELGPHDIVAHVRLGDIVSGLHASYRPLPYLFYREAVTAVVHKQGSTPRRVLLVTNEPDHAIMQRLQSNLQTWLHTAHPRCAPDGAAPCVVEVYSHCMLGDFLLMRSAPNLVLSVSTFSWWAGVLGGGFVVMPCHGNAWPSSAPPAYSCNAAVASESWQEPADGLWTALWEDWCCGGAVTWGSDVVHVAAATGVAPTSILRARARPPAPPGAYQVLGSPGSPAAAPSHGDIADAEGTQHSSAAFMQAACVQEGARQCLFLPPQDAPRAHYIALHLGRWGGMKHLDMLFVGAPLCPQ